MNRETQNYLHVSPKMRSSGRGSRAPRPADRQVAAAGGGPSRSDHGADALSHASHWNTNEFGHDPQAMVLW